MKRMLACLLALACTALLFAGCGKSKTLDESAAVAALTAHLVSAGVMDEGMKLDNAAPLEWNMKDAAQRAVQDTTCYQVELRFADSSTNGVIAERLLGIYAVSLDGKTYFTYDIANDTWQTI